MAKRSDIEAQIAALQSELENADTDDEIWIEENGRQFKVTGRRATSILDRFKDLWETSEEAGDEDQEDEPEGGEPVTQKPKQDKKPAGGGSYFHSRK